MTKEEHGRHFKGEHGNPTTRRVLRPLIFMAFCLVFILLEGAYLVLSQPAGRIIVLVGLAIVAVVFLGLWTWQADDGENSSQRFACRVFPVLLLVLGGIYLFFMPPNNVADEEVHYRDIYAYANLLDPTMDDVAMRQEDYDFTHDEQLYSRDIDGRFWLRQKQGISLWASTDGVVAEDTGITPLDIQANQPQVRIVPALGVLCGRAVGLSGTAVFYLARVFNFLFACALIILAVRLAPLGQTILMTVSLLPMSLHLLGSNSYDAPILGYSLLFCSLMLRLLCIDERPHRSLLVSTVLLAVFMMPCKVVYLPLCLLGMLVPAQRFTSKKAMWTWKLSLLVLPFAATMLFRLAAVLKVSGIGVPENAVSNRLGQEGTFFTISDILAHPYASALFVLRTLYEKGWYYAYTLVGGQLGWLQINTEAMDIQAFIWLLALLVSIVPHEGDDAMPSRGLRLSIVAVFILSSIGILMSMYLGWTFVTETTIQGVQGRYFLPLIPLLLVAARSRMLEAHVDTMPYISMAVGGLDLLYLAQIAFVVLSGTGA